MSDVAAFIMARVEEDEALARAATPGPWRWDNDEFSDAPPGTRCKHDTEWTAHGPDLKSSDGSEVLHASGYDASGLSVESVDAAHIAYWSPDRVLAGCAAKRAIVALHGSTPSKCMTCADGINDLESVLYPCPTMLALARIWSDHEAFDPAWATEVAG